MGYFDHTLIGDIDTSSIVVAILSGGLVGSAVAFFKAPTERFALSSQAQAGIIKNLNDENERLYLKNERLEEQVAHLRDHSMKQDLIIREQEARIQTLEQKIGLA